MCITNFGSFLPFCQYYYNLLYIGERWRKVFWLQAAGKGHSKPSFSSFGGKKHADVVEYVSHKDGWI